MKFSDFNLHPTISAAIDKLGFENCTPIQESAIPLILEGKDVAGLAQTGTGKTAAFVVPLLDRLLRSKNPQAEEERKERIFADWRAQEFILILVPTRELVDQVAKEIDRFKGDQPVRVLPIYGGTTYEKQLEGLKRGVDFIVGTPGRLIDLYKTHAVDFRQVRAIVFDEADRMFDMGFRDDMKFILRRVPRTRQFLVFSATLNFEVLNIAYMHGAEPIECNVSRDQAKAENVKDEIFHCGHDEKPQFLISVLKRESPKQVIIFSNFKHNVERIAQFLNQNGYPAVAISSLLTQAQRNRVIEQFKGQNELNILVATDVAARGLDIKGVDLVFNYELPDDPENYVHRIGRTGRAGQEGTAFSLVCDRDVDALQRIEEYLKHKISVGWLDDNQLIKEFKEFPEYRTKAPREQRGPDSRRDRSGGPQRRYSRPDQRRSDQRRPDQGEQKRPDHRRSNQQRTDVAGKSGPGRVGPGATNGSGQHRDRALGRHGRRHKPHEGRKDNKNRSFDRSRPPHKKSNVQPAKSLGAKILGFFKGLFGRST